MKRKALFCALHGVVMTGAPALSAQVAARDSAAIAGATADSLAALGTPIAVGASIAPRQRAVALYRQSNNRAAEGTQLHRLGIAFYHLSQPDSAMRQFRLAATLRKSLADLRGESLSINNVGLLFDERGQPDSAMVYYGAARGLARALGDPGEESGYVMNIANVLKDVGKADSAIALYREASALARQGGDRASEASIENNIGTLLMDLERTEAAFAQTRRALRLAREIKDTAIEAAALLNMGVLFRVTSAADSSFTYLRQARVIYAAMSNQGGLAQVLISLGAAFSDVGQRDSAIAVLREGAEISRATQNPKLESAAFANLGNNFMQLRRTDSASVYLRRALVRKREIQDVRGEAIALGNLAVLFADARGIDSAEVYATQAAALGTQLGVRAVNAVALNVMARVRRERAQYDSALRYFAEDLAISRESNDRIGAALTMFEMGITLELNRQPARAVAYYDSAAAEQSWVSRRVGGDFNRLTRAEDQTLLYQYWSRAWLAQAKTLGDRRTALAALAASERGRAQALLALMRDTVASVAPGADLVAEGERVVRAATRGGVTVLSYQVTADALFVTGARDDGGVVLERVAIGPDSLARLVVAFRTALGLIDAEGGAREVLGVRGVVAVGAGASLTWRAAGDRLARCLLPTAIASLIAPGTELLVVPQGVVALVPFATLALQRGGPPLGSRFAIRYAPSMATAQAATARMPSTITVSRTASRALIVGNPLMPNVTSSTGARRALSALPFAERESISIARLIGAVALTGKAATESEVRRRISTASIVHLATHGFAYSAETMARTSYVALAPDSAHDGLLTVGEILDDPAMRLRAQLVVLSACQSGLGDLKQAEGTIGFQRALLAKGARRVLVSLWNVSDEATDRLMNSFYRHWLRDRDGPSAAEALRRAQSAVRRITRFAHPKYWSAFQLVGGR